MGPIGSLQASTVHSPVLNTHAHTNPTYLSTLYDTCYDTHTHLFITYYDTLTHINVNTILIVLHRVWT